MDLLPIDLSLLLQQELANDRRPNDGFLHPSSHLTSSMRHVMLDMANAPRIENPLVSDMRAATGTFWHEWVGQKFKKLGLPVMLEVDLSPWMLNGWRGKADWLFWHYLYKAFVLGDLKTTSADGIPFILREGAKHEHIWQASVYWHAAKNMGIPILDRISLQYVPIYLGRIRETEVVEVEVEPIPEAKLYEEMIWRKERVDIYLATLVTAEFDTPDIYPERYLTDALWPEQPRVQKVFKVVDAREVKLVPHWSAQFCPYPEELCACRTRGQTKIGAYTPGPDGSWEYSSRPGYEEVKPTVRPTSY